MVITSIIKQKYRNRFNIYVDGEYRFSVGYDDLIEFDIKENNTYDFEALKDLVYKCQSKKAFNTALKYLASRTRSEEEIKRKLKTGKYGDMVIDDTISRLKQLKLLDDSEFSIMWIEERKRIKPTGKKRIIQELKNKGVEASIIDDALEKYQCNDLDTALSILKKRIKLEKHGLDDLKTHQRIYRYLLYKGIEYDTACNAIKIFFRNTVNND